MMRLSSKLGITLVTGGVFLMANKCLSLFRKARFPAVMALLSLLFFLAAYLFVTLTAVEPQYGKGLLFLIPFLCFGAVTYFTAKGKWKKAVSTALTVVFTAVSVCAIPVAFVFLSCDAATTVTSNVGKYQRVLRISNYPKNALIQNFPDKIPDTAKNTMLSYHPAALQGGESFDLKFDADAQTIRNYVNEFSGKAQWTGKPGGAEAEKHGLFSSSFTSAGYDTLPDSFTVYMVTTKPYQTDNWNHGEVSLAAIDETKQEVIFHAEKW